jgi:hypothetical protein
MLAWSMIVEHNISGVNARLWLGSVAVVRFIVNLPLFRDRWAIPNSGQAYDGLLYYEQRCVRYFGCVLRIS